MTMKIETSHVGSLPRSQKVVDFIFAKEKEQAYDKLAFDETMKEAVELIVKKQKDHNKVFFFVKNFTYCIYIVH